MGQVFQYHILTCNQIMARPLRLEFARALYHVTYRGDRREDYLLRRCCLLGGCNPSALNLPSPPTRVRATVQAS